MTVQKTWSIKKPPRSEAKIVLSNQDAELVFSLADGILSTICEYPKHIANEVIKRVKEGLRDRY